MKTTRHTRKDVERAATLFFAVRGLVRTRLAHGKRLDPSAWLHIETLKFINDNDAPTMRAVAEYLAITAPSATSLIAHLSRKGLITRKGDARDRRTVRLTLTPEGKRILAATITRGMRTFSDLFSALSGPELATFIRSLERIRARG